MSRFSNNREFVTLSGLSGLAALKVQMTNTNSFKQLWNYLFTVGKSLQPQDSSELGVASLHLVYMPGHCAAELKLTSDRTGKGLPTRLTPILLLSR